MFLPNQAIDLNTLSDDDFDTHIDTLTPTEAIEAISQRRGVEDADQYAHWRKAVLNKQRDAAQRKLNAKHKPFDPSRYNSYPEMKRAEALYNQQISQQQDEARATIDTLDKQIADINQYQNRRNAQIAAEREAENPLRNGISPSASDSEIGGVVEDRGGSISQTENLKSEEEVSTSPISPFTSTPTDTTTTSEVVGRSLSADESQSLISQMEQNAEVAPEVELTPENWINLFGENGIVETPIGPVKMGENQYFKLAQQGRNGKLGMVKPTLQSPSFIIEDSKPEENSERDSSYIFVKTFTKQDGSRFYYFTSVTVSKEGKEVVISNQEKSANKISKLLQNGKIAWIDTAFSLHPTTQIEESVPLNDSNKPTSTDNQPALLGINSPELSSHKDTSSSSQSQEINEEINKQAAQAEVNTNPTEAQNTSTENSEQSSLNGENTNNLQQKINNLQEELIFLQDLANRQRGKTRRNTQAQIEHMKQTIARLINEASKNHTPTISQESEQVSDQVSNQVSDQDQHIDSDQAKLAHIDTWKRSINAPIVVLSNIHEVNNPQARAAIASATLSAQRYPGWFSDGTIYLYLPHCTDTTDIDRTILHECIAHYGVRKLFPSPHSLNRFYDQVWNMMQHNDRQRFLQYPGISNLTGNKARRAAADEYIAHLAEQLHTQGTTITPEQTSIWQRIVSFLRNALRQAGINLRLSDTDLNNLLISSYNNLRNNTSHPSPSTSHTTTMTHPLPSERRVEGYSPSMNNPQQATGEVGGNTTLNQQPSEKTGNTTNTTPTQPLSPSTSDTELDIFLRENRAANDRHREQWKSIPRPRDLEKAYEAGNTQAIEQWKAGWEAFLQQLIPMDLPVIDGTITTASRNKAVKMVQTPQGYKVDKDSPAYKAFDHIEKSLVKRRRQLERNLSEEERRTIDIVKRGLRGELNNAPDTRFRFIGERGAANLDQSEEATTRLDNLAIARSMEQEGRDERTIKLATGWERGADNLWRYEIPDTPINQDALLTKHQSGATITILAELIDDEQLFKAYPELYDMVVAFQQLPLGELGNYSPRNAMGMPANIILSEEFLSRRENPQWREEVKRMEQLRIIKQWSDAMEAEPFDMQALEDAERQFKASPLWDEYNTLLEGKGKYPRYITGIDGESTLAHEVQHAIQDIEGFARGGNEHTADHLRDKARVWAWRNALVATEKEHPELAGTTAIEQLLIDEYTQDGLQEYIPTKEQRIKGFNLYVRGYDNEGYQAAWEQMSKIRPGDKRGTYRRLAGEVEARNVANRLNYTPEERANTLARITEDVAREDQIFISQALGNPAMGSRVEQRMKEIATHYQGRTLSSIEQAIIEVFTGNNDNMPISVKTADGNTRRIIMRQGKEQNAGTRHSLFRHYNTGSGVITAEDLLLIPEVIANGTRTEKGKGKIEYRYTHDNGTKYTVLTEIDDRRETFADFYTNRKTSSAARQTHSEEARDTANDVSADKDTTNNPNTQTMFRSVDNYTVTEDIKRIVGISSQVRHSHYASGTTDNGETWQLRISNHPAAFINIEDHLQDDEQMPDYFTSIVITDNPDVITRGRETLEQQRRRFNNSPDFENIELDQLIIDTRTLNSDNYQDFLDEFQEHFDLFRHTGRSYFNDDYGTRFRSITPSMTDFRAIRPNESITDYAEQIILRTANYNNKLPGSHLRFRMTHRTESTVSGWINQRTDLNPTQRHAIIRYIDTLDSTAMQLATARWFTLGTIRIPDDITRVRQAMQVAHKAKVDPLTYDYPMAILNQFPNLNPSTQPINPDDLPTLNNKQSLPHGITIYNVDETPQAQQHIRDIIDTHLGTRANPWCITSAINGRLTDEARQFWKAYNAHPKRVAFRDGRIIAFFAADIPIPIWWDTQDRPHAAIPIAPLTEYNEQNNTIDTYNPDGIILNSTPAEQNENENPETEQTVSPSVYSSSASHSEDRGGGRRPEGLNQDNDSAEDRGGSISENENLKSEEEVFTSPISPFTSQQADATIAHIEQIGDDYTRYIDNIAEQVEQALTPQPTDDARTLAEKAILRFRFTDDTTIRSNSSEWSDEEQDIIDQAKTNGTYLLAPNGRPTNLTPRQWVQVRTRTFKEWFGDWLKQARVNKLRYATDATITGNEIEITDNEKQNKKNALEYGKTLQGEYTNKDTGNTIQLQRGRKNGGINEVLQHNYKDAEHLQSIAAIPQIIVNSIFVEEVPNKDTSKNPDVVAYQHYVCGLKIGNTDYTVHSLVAVDKKGDRYYDHNLIHIEKIKLLDIVQRQAVNEIGFGTTPDTESTTNSDYKYNALLSILQTNSSKIVDENGEPKVVRHNTNNKFNIFNDAYRGSNTGDMGVYGAGFYFGNIGQTNIYGYHEMDVFLNMRNPKILPDDNIMTFFDYILENFDEPALHDIIINDAFNENRKTTLGKLINSIKEIKEADRQGEYNELISQMQAYWGKGAHDLVLERKIFDKAGAGILRQLTNFVVDNISPEKFTNGLKKAGYDGVIKDWYEYIAFSPNQIKSATDNIGTFDNRLNDIRFRSVKDGEFLNRNNLTPEEFSRLTNSIANAMDTNDHNHRMTWFTERHFDSMQRLANLISDIPGTNPDSQYSPWITQNQAKSRAQAAIRH